MQIFFLYKISELLWTWLHNCGLPVLYGIIYKLFFCIMSGFVFRYILVPLPYRGPVFC